MKTFALSVLFLLVTSPLWAANVYWASSAGSNTPTCSAIKSTGTADAPGTDPGSYGTIGAAANCATVGGDVVNIKAGTYTNSNNRIKTDAETTGFASGTSLSVQTYLQGNPGSRPLISFPNFYQTYDTTAGRRNYITIRNLTIDGTGGSDAGGAEIFMNGAYVTVDNVEVKNSYAVAVAAITGGTLGLSTTSHHHTIRNSNIHGAGGGEGAPGQGNAYCFYFTTSDALIENNECHGNKGSGGQIYADQWAVPNGTLRYNYFHDMILATRVGQEGRCTGMAFNGPNTQIYNNIFDGTSCTTLGATNSYGIAGGYQTTNKLLVYNNVIVNWRGYGITYGIFAKTLNNEFTNNIILGNASGAYANESANSSTVTTTTNKTTGLVTDCTVSTTNFVQKGGSACLNAGTAISGHSYNDSAPDIGAFEKMILTTCSVENGDAGTLRISLSNNAFPPLQPVSGITGFTARKAGVNDPITAAVRTGTNRIDLTLTNAIVNGDTIDFSSSGSGNVTDSILIANSLNQPFNSVLTNQTCINNVGGADTSVKTQTVFRWNGLRGTEAAPVATPYAGAPENTNILIVPGGKARLRVGISCTVADCPPLAFIPRYSRNGGSYTVVPDVFSTDNIGMCGTSPDVDIPSSGTATTQQLSGSGTFKTGALIRTSNAVPSVDMVLNGRTELEYCIAIDSDTASGDTFDFRAYLQDGTPITYNVTPRATVIGTQANFGF